jgi:hypothetical protein
MSYDKNDINDKRGPLVVSVVYVVSLTRGFGRFGRLCRKLEGQTWACI